MTQFEKFEEAFDKRFIEDGDGIWEFIELVEEEEELPFGGKLVADLDELEHDSYGYENSRLKKVIYFEEFDLNIMFTGTRQSYAGEDWYGYKEVKESTKVVKTWE